MSRFDPYATLHVTPDADDDVIVAAYRALARRHHPDHAGESGTLAMATINAAWELIGNKEARAAYDRERRTSLQAVGPGRAADAGPGWREASPAGGATGANRTAPAGAAAASAHGEARARAQALWFSPAADGTGAAGAPPGRPSGSILPFGRHIGWSLGEIARVDPGYLEWLENRPQARPYRDEIDALLRRIGRRDDTPEAETGVAGGSRWRRG